MRLAAALAVDDVTHVCIAKRSCAAARTRGAALRVASVQFKISEDTSEEMLWAFYDVIFAFAFVCITRTCRNGFLSRAVYTDIFRS